MPFFAQYCRRSACSIIRSSRIRCSRAFSTLSVNNINNSNDTSEQSFEASNSYQKHLNSEGTPMNLPDTNPMEILSRVFGSNKHAVLQHRELITCLANGDETGAVEVAAILARTIKKAIASSETPNGSTDKDLPVVDNDAIEATSEKLASFLKNKTSASGDLPPGGLDSSDRMEPWSSPDALRLIVVETLFETEAEDSEEERTANEDLAMEVLDRYLVEEADKWRAQKNQIASVVLHAAKSCGVTPLDLHACENSMLRFRQTGELNPMKHVNLVIRGEIPSALDARNPERSKLLEKEIERDMERLKTQMNAQGNPLNALEEKMALYELRRSKTVMRYSVGIHHDLRKAFDTSKAVRKIMSLHSSSGAQISKEVNTNGSEFFISHAIKMLNEPEEYNSSTKTNSMYFTDELSISLLESPVIPFTFMLKCCLWFDVPK